MSPAEPKRVATAKARLALRGVTLHAIEGDLGQMVYIATQHAMTRSFDDLAELERWVDLVDGRRKELAA